MESRADRQISHAHKPAHPSTSDQDTLAQSVGGSRLSQQVLHLLRAEKLAVERAQHRKPQPQPQHQASRKPKAELRVVFGLKGADGAIASSTV